MIGIKATQKTTPFVTNVFDNHRGHRWFVPLLGPQVLVLMFLHKTTKGSIARMGIGGTAAPAQDIGW
jgi:hypothetical protein